MVSNGWCGGGCQLCMMARDAAERLPDEVALTEVLAWEKDDMRARGESIDMLYVDGAPYRPDGPPPSLEELEADLLLRHQTRSG